MELIVFPGICALWNAAYQRLLFSVFAERNNKSTERDDHAERCERITHKDS